MKVTKEKMRENHAAIIAAASAEFRKHGFDGVTVAEIMKAAGQTHGSFYGHFESKEQLIEDASAHALDAALDYWRGLVQREPGNPLGSVARIYLSEGLRDDASLACAFATLGSDVVRGPKDLRALYSAKLRDYIRFLSAFVRGNSARQRRKKAITAMSQLVGAMVLARAVNDIELSNEILEATVEEFASEP